MIPLRLLILAVLCYFGWRLLRRFMAPKPADPVVNDTHQESDPEPLDMLVEDPFCHTLIPKNQAVRLRKDDTTYYFCSEQCCDKFSGQPEKGEK